MKRRSAIALIVVVVLLLATALALRWAMRPQTLGPQVLGMAGRALGLEISAGQFDYRLRGSPQLVARQVSARVPGADAPLIEAERIFISVPWSTLRARGADLTVTRIELDAPKVWLQPFMDWWSQRPPGDGPLPTLADGLLVKRGHVEGGEWSLRDIDIDLPYFAPGERVRGAVRGRYEAQAFDAPFNLRLAMTRPAAGAGIGIAGTASPQADDWRLPNRIVLSARLAPASPGAPGIRLQGLRLSSASRYESPGTRQAFALGLAAEAAFAGGALSLEPAALALRGKDLVPDLDGRGRLAYAQALALELTGDIRRWPQTWPALPPPIGDADTPLPFRLAYSGPASLADPLRLELQHDQARFEGSLRVADVTSWFAAIDSGTPLPPLDGRLTVPRIDVAGASLHGVEVTFDDAPADTGTQ
ncbi:hypothetical protein ACOPJQ_09340 [Luteimonas dalianensis]|uniref:hypothetical protein n=1 Tax=Luteimonas dalianensis TaxID=1148196 RepID=UPI003BF1D1E9